MGANDGAYLIASELCGLNNRTDSAQIELVNHRVQIRRYASVADYLTAPHSSTYSSSIASSLIAWESAVFDKKLITFWS